MKKHLLLLEASAGMLGVVDRIGEADLRSPTPCAEWDVGALRAHLLQWGPALEGAARKERTDPDAALDGAAPKERTDPDAAHTSLREQMARLAEAWGEPGAWDGTTHMGPAELPADLVGGMVLGEFVLHGWDLAQALGAPVEWSDDVLRLLYREVERSADQGRSMGVYGAEVPVPPSAPLLSRTLALSGRNPHWRA